MSLPSRASQNEPADLARAIEEFLLEAPRAALLEHGEVLFDFSAAAGESAARYSISSDRGHCVLHVWSPERNLVRRVTAVDQPKGQAKHALRLATIRLGQSKPTSLELVADRAHRSPGAQKAERDSYLLRLQRTLERHFCDLTHLNFTNKTDLERSFGPAYARGMQRRGRAAWACIGVSSAETQAVIDGALTIGILWLDHLRERYAADLSFSGLRVVAPPGSSQVIRMRAAHLTPMLRFEVLEFDERDNTLSPRDIFDRGNFATNLVHCVDPVRTLERYAASISRVRELVPELQPVVISAAEISLRYRGLQFARIRSSYLNSRESSGNALHLSDEVLFGIGPAETTLDDTNLELFRDITARLQERRGGAKPSQNAARDPLWRAQPERWLESAIVANITRIDTSLDARYVYSQVPAFTASDRGVIDILSSTHSGRLAVLELKAEEDIHLPLQGLDYWSRVRHHQQRGDFERFGYFAGKQLAPSHSHDSAPLLMLVAPALHIHPATDTLVRYFAPEIDCTVVGIDERWRSVEGPRVVFRKRR